MSQTRLLTKSDIGEFSLLLDRKYHAKELKSSNADNKFLDQLEKSSEESLIRIYGHYNDLGELTSAVCQYLWLNFPSYTVLWGLIHPRYITSKFNKSLAASGARECFDACVIYGESINRWQFYYGMTLRNFNVRRKIFLEQDTAISSRYDRYVETVIRAGELPDYEPWRQIIGYAPRKEDTIIRTGRLKNEHIIKLLNERQILTKSYEDLYG
jgi:hypothetical protein